MKVIPRRTPRPHVHLNREALVPEAAEKVQRRDEVNAELVIQLPNELRMHLHYADTPRDEHARSHAEWYQEFVVS